MHLKTLLWACPIAVLASCSNADTNSHYAGNAAVSKSETMNADSTTVNANVLSLTSPSRKIIHTADFSCRVQNVFSATSQLENLVKSLGGIVQESRMENETTETKTLAYKTDSLKQIQTYTTVCYLTLRVPVARLDSVNNTIPALATFIDHRVLKQDDVTLRYMANVMKNEAVSNKTEAGKAMKLATKSGEVINAESYLEDKQNRHIDRSIDNMQLLDNVSYATLTVTLSQPEQMNVHIIMNPQYYAYTPFGTQVATAIRNGWELLAVILVGIIHVWPLLTAVILIWISIKKFRRKNLLPVKRAI